MHIKHYIAASVIAVMAFPFQPASAKADATVAPSARADQVDRIIREAFVPTVDDPDVIVGACPYATDDFGCTFAAKGSPIYISPEWLGPFTLLHELGHRYQFDVMTSGSLRRFMTIMRLRHWTSDVQEQFADAYASCALGWEPLRSASAEHVDTHFPTGYGYWPTRDQQDRVCDLIARADP